MVTAQGKILEFKNAQWPRVEATVLYSEDIKGFVQASFM